MAERRPDFLYIGASKAGSSWIYEILREHPEVFVPEAKDIQFFDRFYGKGLDWYLGHFRSAGTAVAAGEVSHDYFLAAETARRIHGYLPKVKLVCCLREPAERTVSAYLYNLTTHVAGGTGFASYASRPEVLRQNDYLGNLLPFYELFAADRILVLFYDDLKRDPAAFTRELYSFLGVRADFYPPSLHRVVLPARAPRSRIAAHLAYAAGGLLRRLGLSNLVGAAKRSRLLEDLLYRPIVEKPEIPAEAMNRIRERFRGDYDRLGELIGRRIPESWTAG